jgi:hypothetical protein
MLTTEGSLKLLDFGVAKRESDAASNRGDAGAFVVVGTPEYMAPEQARGVADLRSDVYALGAALYELVTGALPHEAPSIAALLERKLAGAPGPASALAPEQRIPKALDRLLERALAPDPAARFQTMRELRSALEGLVERDGGRTLRRGMLYATLGAVTFVAMAVVGANVSGSAGTRWSDHRRFFESSLAGVLGRAKIGATEPAAAGVRTTPPAEPVATVESVAVEPPPPAPPPPAGNAASEAPLDMSPEPSKNEPAERALAEFEKLVREGRALKALHAIRKAAHDFPNEPSILRAHAKAAQESKAWGEARRAAARWVEVDPSTEARLSLARLERATGNGARAFALLTQLEREDPKSDEVRRLLALLPADHELALNR